MYVVKVTADGLRVFTILIIPFSYDIGFHDHRGCPLPDTCVPETEQCPSEIGMYDQQGCLIHEEMLSTAPNEIVCHETDMHTVRQKIITRG